MRFNIRPIVTMVIAVVGLMVVQSAAQAHFIWATVQNGQVRFALLENVNDAPQTQFAKYVANLSPRCKGKALTLGETREGARYAAVPAGQGVVTAESVVGAKEREGKSYLLVYHAKGAVSLSAAATLTKGPAELLARKAGKELVVSLRRNGMASARTEVWVQWPGREEASEEKSFQTDHQGDVRISWPPATSTGGFVGIRAMVNEDKTGVSTGTSYVSIHHWTTLTFPLEGTQADGIKTAVVTEEGKPLTRVLRDAYGSNHELAGSAAFNRTLFASKLTREQLEIHLQQRALIHSDLHRILNAASHRTSLPYDAAQKRVLVLLFDDLISLGLDWPTEAQARPLTRAFLQEIRDSEKRGPYFALGVWHVYYGGITNGGRLIGKKIDETLKFMPSYYEKSDGYSAYLAEVNRIADPAARQEMIRGGQQAYRYIIAFSNEEVFQEKIGHN